MVTLTARGWSLLCAVLLASSILPLRAAPVEGRFELPQRALWSGEAF